MEKRKAPTFQQTIYSVMQDNRRWFYLDRFWMASAFRYDGKTFKRFTTEDGISDNEVFRIYQDHLGRIWFFTFNGHLSFWKQGKIYNAANTPFLKEAYTGGSIRTCTEDKKGRLWIGTENYGFILITNDDVKKIKVNVVGVEQPSIYILEDSEGNIWSFKGVNRMFKLFEKDFKDTIFIPNIENRSRFSYCSNSSEVLFNSTSGVFKISNGRSSMLIDSGSLPSFKKIGGIFPDGQNIWVCTSGEGCFMYKNGKVENIYLENVYVTSVLRDREGNLWFATLGKGLFMLPEANNLTTNYNNLKGLSGGKVISLAPDQNGSVWLGYENGVVDKISGNKKKSYKLTNSDDQGFAELHAC